jgi:hypothetical protein
VASATASWDGAYVQHQVVRIYLLVGEPEKALDLLEPPLKIPYELSPAWLKIDPNFTRYEAIRASSCYYREVPRSYPKERLPSLCKPLCELPAYILHILTFRPIILHN